MIIKTIKRGKFEYILKKYKPSRFMTKAYIIEKYRLKDGVSYGSKAFKTKSKALEFLSGSLK